jgi:hypothetical protein
MAGQSIEKKPGAPAGNLNRLKHGFYSAQLRDINVEAARRVEIELDEEIALFRALLKKYIDMAAAATNAEKMGWVLELAGRALARLGNLVRIQRAFRERNWDESVEAVLSRVLEDLDEFSSDPGNG